MRRTILGAAMVVGFGFAVTTCARTQDKAAQPVQSEGTAPAPATVKKLTIEVSGGEKNVAVENASVYVKYVEERKVLKDKKLELNVKTGHEGVAHVPNAPPGRVLIQVVADGWKSFGRWYDITDPNQTFKI